MAILMEVLPSQVYLFSVRMSLENGLVKSAIKTATFPKKIKATNKPRANMASFADGLVRLKNGFLNLCLERLDNPNCPFSV